MNDKTQPPPVNTGLFAETVSGRHETSKLSVPYKQASEPVRVWTPPPSGLSALADIERRMISPDQKNPIKDVEIRFFDLAKMPDRTVAESLEFRMACALAVQVRKKGTCGPSPTDINRIAQAKAAVNKTEDEEFLCRFPDFTIQTSEQRRLFSALMAKIRSSDRDKRARQKYLIAQQKPSERRLLVHKKIQRGGLCYVANAQHLDPETFVGMLTWALKHLAKHGSTWKADGETVLAERRAVNNEKW